MDSSSIHRSPRNVRIAKLKIEGGPHLPCPHRGCILAFTAPGSLRQHSWTGKHKFTSNLNPPSPPTSARLLQRFKPWLTVKSPAETLHTGWTSNWQQCIPLYSDSEGSDNELSLLVFPPAASPTYLPLNSPMPTPQEGSTSDIHSSLSSSSSRTSTTQSSTSTSSSSSSSSKLPSSLSKLPSSPSPTTHVRDLPPASHSNSPNAMDTDS